MTADTHVEPIGPGDDTFRILADAAPVMLWMTDSGGQCVFFNRRWLEFRGRPLERELGRGWLEGLHPDDVARCRSEFERHLLEQRPFTLEYRLQTAGGEYRWLFDQGVPRFSADGAFSGFLGTCVDITDRKRAEESLRESDRRLQAILDSMPAIVFVVDRESRYQFVNRAFEEQLAVPRERALGRTPAEVFEGAVAKQLTERYERVWTSEQPHEEIMRVSPRGEPRVYRVLRFPLRDERGTAYAVCGVAVDATDADRARQERERVEQQLQHAQKLESLGVLAGGIAHDFNNLLVGVLGNAGLALMELPSSSPAWQPVKQIEIAALRAAELTRQMLAYSGKGRFTAEPLNLSRLVEEMVHLLQSVISRRAMLRFDVAQALPPILGDATQVRQVVMNLITNASDALGDKAGIVVVRTGLLEVDEDCLRGSLLGGGLPVGPYAYLEVSDTGSGIDSDTMKRIFDPFFSTKFTGRGLGLAAVLGIVRSHRGLIRMDSEPGRGSTFRVLFPAAEIASEAPRAPAPARAPWRGSGTVLFADDDESVRSVAKRALERYGFTVLLAVDGREAVDLYRRKSDEIVCALLDLTMPRMGGEDAFRELRRLNPDLNVILMSGYNAAEVTSEFAGLGFAGFLQKPFQIGEMVDALRSALKRRRATDA